MVPISFEYFPPKTTEQKAIFEDTHARLKALKPEYFSVTFGAGGSTLEHTRETVLGINQEVDQRVAPHISCLGGSGEGIFKMLDEYRQVGIDRIVALRGDMPSGMAVGFSMGMLRLNEPESAPSAMIHLAPACTPASSSKLASETPVHSEAESRPCDRSSMISAGSSAHRDWLLPEHSRKWLCVTVG